MPVATRTPAIGGISGMGSARGETGWAIGRVLLLIVPERRVSAADRRRRARAAGGRRGGRLGAVGRARGGAVHVEALDPHGGAGALDRGLHLGLQQSAGGSPGRPPRRPAAAARRRSSTLITCQPNGDCTGFSLTWPACSAKAAVGEFRHHVAAAEEAEVAALARPGAGRAAPRDLGEIGPAAHFGQRGARLGLGRHQDVAGMHLLLGRAAGDLAGRSGRARRRR